MQHNWQAHCLFSQKTLRSEDRLFHLNWSRYFIFYMHSSWLVNNFLVSATSSLHSFRVYLAITGTGRRTPSSEHPDLNVQDFRKCPISRSPARVREQWVLAPVSYISVVIAVMDGLGAVFGGQVVMGRWRRGVLSGCCPAPLSQRLFCAVGRVERMGAQHTWLGLGYGHVQHPCVVLVPRGGMWQAGRQAELRGGRLAGDFLIGHSGNIRQSGLKGGAASTYTAAANTWGGRRGGLAILMKSVKTREFNIEILTSGKKLL